MSSKKSDIWHSYSYFNELQKEDKAKYNHKTTLTNGQLLPDLYGIVESWKSDVELMSDASWGDMYNYLLNSSSKYTNNNLKAFEITGNFRFFCVQPCSRHLLYIMKLQKNLNFAVSKQRYKSIYLNIFII